MMRILIIITVLFLSTTSCNRVMHKNESIDCHCDERQVWKLVLETESIKKIYDDGRLIIDNAYSYDNSRRAYWDFFTCRFYTLVMDPNESVDSLQNMYGVNLWNYGKELNSKRNIRYSINVLDVVNDYENVIFYDVDSLKNADEVDYPYGATFYPYGEIPNFCNGKTSIKLDDNSHGAYIIGIDLDSCKVINDEYYWYPYYTGYCGVAASEIDWVDIINFDMSLDSFYQYQYYDVLQYLDSLSLAGNPDIDTSKLYRNHPKLKGKW